MIFKCSFCSQDSDFKWFKNYRKCSFCGKHLKLSTTGKILAIILLLPLFLTLLDMKKPILAFLWSLFYIFVLQPICYYISLKN